MAQGCGGGSERPLPRGSVEKAGAPAQAAAEDGAPTGPLRVLIDGEPQALAADGDLWGARIARLLGDPVLVCAEGDRPAATLSAEAPNRLLLRPRDGVSTADLSRALEAARIADVLRIETAGGLVRVSARRPNLRLKDALCDVRVPGSGPFHAVPAGDGAQRGGPLVLTRAPGGTGTVSEIRMLPELDPARALARLRHGEADILGRLPEAYWPEQADAPATRRAFAAVRVGGVRLSYLVWNLRRSPGSEPDVRRALGEVLDLPRLARELHRGLAEPAAPGPPLDLADATARLERAGWRDTGAVRTREGRLLRVTLLYAAQGGHAARLAAAWKIALARIGVELLLSAADGPGFQTRLREGTFDVALCERPTPPGRDPGPLVGARGADNFSGAAVPVVEAALERFRGATAGDDEVWRAVVAEGALVPLFRRYEIALVSRRVAGVRASGDWLDLSGARWQP